MRTFLKYFKGANHQMKLTSKRLAAVALAGALALPASAALPGAPTAAKSSAQAGQKFIDLKKVPKPKISGAEMIEGLEDFVERFPLRTSMAPANEAAAKFLAEEAEGYGFKVKIHEFQAGTPARTVRVVEAIKKGRKKPKDWIAFIAHYDTIANAGVTVQGAYDDGSGTNMLRYFGKAFSKQPMNKSIALLWFDAEENGLLASRAYAEMVHKRGQKISAGFGFDMVGIGHPAPYCICVYHGQVDGPLAEPIIDYVNFKHLKFPEGNGSGKWPVGGEGHVCNCGPNIRNSDEQSFSRLGYFTMRWTGMKTALDYPGYHQPWDTVPFMEVVAEGRENLELGTENTFNSAWYTTFIIDNLP
jgi:hypothetical protein